VWLLINLLTLQVNFGVRCQGFEPWEIGAFHDRLDPGAPRRRRRRFAILLAHASAPVVAQGEVNIYSYREPGFIDPLLKAFTAKTGIKTNVVFASAGLNERLAAEGENSPADLLFTVDAGRLSEAKDAGLTQPVKTKALDVVPPAYRDPEGHWYGLTMRARIIYASREAGCDHLRGTRRPQMEG
jgi:hypothetical protein